MPKQLNAESSEDISHLFSNKKVEDMEDVPNGGFPPIFIVNTKYDEKVVDTKQRLLETTLKSISIKDILASKKK